MLFSQTLSNFLLCFSYFIFICRICNSLVQLLFPWFPWFLRFPSFPPGRFLVSFNKYLSHIWGHLTKHLLSQFRFWFILTSEAAARRDSSYLVFLKFSHYSQEKTCAGSSFWNPTTLLKTQVFFTEYCEIFKNSFFDITPLVGCFCDF